VMYRETGTAPSPLLKRCGLAYRFRTLSLSRCLAWHIERMHGMAAYIFLLTAVSFFLKTFFCQGVAKVSCARALQGCMTEIRRHRICAIRPCCTEFEPLQ
jgi:hypothetical protein